MSAPVLFSACPHRLEGKGERTLKKKSTKKSNSIPMGIAYGLVASILLTLIGTAVLAFLVSGEQLPEQAMDYGAVVTLLLSSVTGALVCCKAVRQKILLMAIISGAAYFVILLCCTAMFFGGQYQGVGQTALLVLGGSIAAGLLQISGSAKTKKHRKSYTFR